ncbi:uncharacterized protein TNCV_1013021 [Trichonephila clavipes]|uniref:Peptidase A2 domain-containing protein n=1 Tax=Trichonephila clavipes TaxID=2585209 RepID=A0A8X6VXE8_TRICX|nr:uncharacterized protein TNCV_1013021 [Trichonephila clavipes]
MPRAHQAGFSRRSLAGVGFFESVRSYRVVEDKATNYAHLKQALTEQFPVVRNRSELETRFYTSYQDHNQRPSDFVYELSKIHKQLKLDMREEKLLDHVISRRSTGWFEERGFQGSEWSKHVFKLLSDRCESGGDRSQSTENPPDMEQRTIRISSLRMTPVDLPYVPILLNETFITALWDTGAEKTFISEEVYRRYFHIDRVKRLTIE